MYSLYRAWLSMGPSTCTLPTSIQGDLNLRPTPPNPCGAPDVSLLVGPTLTHFSAHKRILSQSSGFFKAALNNHTGYEPITVANVNIDEFSSLLTFMYTGFLDLNFTNIYNILLATHILHMPSAMEICRNFLLQNQPSSLEISRVNIIKPIPSRKSILPSTSVLHTPLFGTLRRSTDTSFKSLTIIEDKSQEMESKTDEPLSLTVGDKNNCEGLKKINSEEATSSGIKDKKFGKNKKKIYAPSREKYEIDVACCDGPVRFHRVLNKNFGHFSSDPCPNVQPVNKNDAINRIMNENIRELNSGDAFKCVYCNHTFKSQYCYQKHARRHLNPVPESAKTTAKKAEKREVKLLDLNVQYYPCKMCGSKFPSYYFVHKHRKLCHADAGEDITDSNEQPEKKLETKENESINNDQIQEEKTNEDNSE